MSYILDALRKSDLQRQHGSAPTLQSTALLARPHERSHLGLYLSIAALLIAAGIAIGTLRPWQGNGAAHDNRNISPVPTRDLLNAPPVPLESVVTPQPARPQSERQPSHAAPPPALPRKEKSAAPARPHVQAAPAASDTKVLAFSELPPAIQHEIPALTVTVHAYSANAAERMVGINNSILREGATVAPGLKLEEIAPEGMVLSYKGYRFKRGVRN